MLRRRKSTSIIAVVLVIVLLSGVAMLPALATGGPYRIVLRYYDPIQITYSIKYPVGDGRDDWTGPEDVPIGGVGVPGAGEYDIIDYLSSQIYCVDPFVPFHNRVPGLGGNFIFNGGANADTVSGYVEAAPWVMSGAMLAYGEAVQWIAANGYRGVYTTTGVLTGSDDQESKDSVARLNKMFPGIGTIDKEIAVMATKVAIWNIVAGDNIQIVKTTIDGTPKRAIFDALVQALVTEGNKFMQPGPRILLPGEISATSLEIAISDTGATYDEDINVAYNYYGPMTVTATLKNPSDSAPPDMDKVFLSISGLNSDGVRFTSQKAATLTGELPTSNLYGTNQSTQYVSGSVSGGVWTSNEFYLAIPASRTYPERGDQLMVKAQTMAADVPVQEGTPVVFAYSLNGEQDWDAIQAFIGGTTGSQQVDLYAETTWHTGDTSLGELYISKIVDNPTQDNVNDEFTFAVYYNESSDFGTASRLNLTEYPVLGAFKVNTGNNTFTLKNGGLALIQGLPMVVSGGDTSYDYYYWVEETGVTGDYETPHLVVDTGNPSGQSVTGNRIGPFRLDEDYEMGFVTVTNTNIPDRPDRPGGNTPGDLIIIKSLEGGYSDWGVDESTVFLVRIKDTTKNNYLLFKATPEADGSYWCVGNSVDGLSEPYSGATTTELPVSVEKPLGISNLWLGAVYEAEEVDSQNCTTTIIGNGAIYTPGQSSSITVVNTYEHGTGALVIVKRLEGDFGNWGVNNTSTFTVRIKDATGDNYLLFKTEPEADGSFWCVGNDVDGLSEDYTGATTTELKFSVVRSLTLTNLWTNLLFEVEEIGGSGYAISYIGNGVTFQDGQNSVVTVVNTYEPGVPDRPTEPSEPPEPNIPEIPIEPNEPPTGGNEPPTGDNNNLVRPIVLILLGIGCIITAEYFRRRNRKVKDS